MTTTYNITLDGESLPASSFSLRATAESFTGSFIIEGHELSEYIADHIDDTIRIYQNTTEICSGVIDRVDAFISTTTRKLSVFLKLMSWTQAAYTSVPDITSDMAYAAQQNYRYSFRIPQIDGQLQHGQFMLYDGVSYFISGITITYDAGGFGYTTLNEGTPTGSSSYTGACVTSFDIGDDIDDEFVNACRAASVGQMGWRNDFGRYRAWNEAPPDLRPAGIFVKQYSLNLASSTAVTIKLISDLPDYTETSCDFYVYGGVPAEWRFSSSFLGSMGILLIIASGEFTTVRAQVQDNSFATLTPGETFSGTLPAGLYTLQCLLFSFWTEADRTFTIETTGA